MQGLLPNGGSHLRHNSGASGSYQGTPRSRETGSSGEARQGMAVLGTPTNRLVGQSGQQSPALSHASNSTAGGGSNEALANLGGGQYHHYYQQLGETIHRV